jgi:hypothetical protein
MRSPEPQRITQAAVVAHTDMTEPQRHHPEAQEAQEAAVLAAMQTLRSSRRRTEVPTLAAAAVVVRVVTERCLMLAQMAAPASSSFAISAPSVQQAARSRAQAATRSTRSRRAAHLT